MVKSHDITEDKMVELHDKLNKSVIRVIQSLYASKQLKKKKEEKTEKINKKRQAKENTDK